MRELFFALSHYFAVVLLAFCAYVFGRRLTLGVRYHSPLEQMSFSIALGLGVLAYVVFTLGLCGLLNPAMLISLLLIGLLICRRVWWGWLSRVRDAETGVDGTNKRQALSVVVVLSILFLPLVILPLYPPTAWDATMYHLAYAKIYVQNHQLVLTPYLRFPVFPQNNEMLFTLALQVQDDVLAQLVEFLMMAVLVAAMIAFGWRFFSRRAGLWAGAILLQSPLVIWLGTVAYVELGLMLFVMMTVYALWNFLESRQQHWLILAGAFCGLAMGTKYTGLFFLLVLTVVALFAGWKRRNLWQSLRPLALAIVIFAPWIVRNFYYTKNPLFPFFYDVFGRAFGYELWKPEDFHEMHRAIYSQLGVGKDIEALILLPWNLVAHWRSFGALISPLCLFAPHLLFIFGIARERTRGLLTIGAAFTLYWFFAVQDPRHLMPALPLLSLATAASFDSLLLRWPSPQRLTSHKLATILGALLLLAPGWAWTLLRLRERGPLPVSAQQRDAYLTRELPSYPAYKLLNDLKGRDYRLYALRDERMAYFADGVFMGDHFGPAKYTRILDHMDDSQRLYDELRSLKADYFLVRNDLARVTLPHDAFFQSRFKLVYEQAGILLFELTPVTARSFQSTE
ncbi:MAG: glycosyltransferase family 39 protein [Acidobacteriota bacterium]